MGMRKNLSWIGLFALTWFLALMMVPGPAFPDKHRNRNHGGSGSGSGSGGGSGSGSGSGGGTNSAYQIFSFNDLGMHCYDSDFSKLAVLPPYNVLRAQVVLKGQNPIILDSTRLDLTYKGIADPTGSINTTSANKTNFWTYVQKLFGVSPAVNVGLKGAAMPGSGNTPQPFPLYDAAMKWFAAEGIPITIFDDAGKRNPLSLMRVSALNKTTGAVLATLDTVVPASDEMNCNVCHATGGQAANAATTSKYKISQAWSTNSDAALQVKDNVMILHDAINKTTLYANQPVLCASCHYSAALDLENAGPQGAQTGHKYLSRAMHQRHGLTVAGTVPDAQHPAIVAGTTTDACYQCHPGATTKCLRGAMATAGIGCQDCHGGMLAVGGYYNLKSGSQREPWKDLPKCQSCHTGDAVNNQGSALIQTKAYSTTDPAATPILAANKRFAESDTTLYRLSLGHNGMACESCHGSPHAIWPTRAGTNDNITATQIQGHDGIIVECTACHGTGMKLTMNGPHGMHNVNDPNWNMSHEDFAERNKDSCRACHGLKGEGTVLSEVKADRTLQGDDRRTVKLTKGTAVSCNLCHENKL